MRDRLRNGGLQSILQSYTNEINTSRIRDLILLAVGATYYNNLLIDGNHVLNIFQIIYTVYWKSTHTGNYLGFLSNHPYGSKCGVATSLFYRAFRIRSAVPKVLRFPAPFSYQNFPAAPKSKRSVSRNTLLPVVFLHYQFRNAFIYITHMLYVILFNK